MKYAEDIMCVATALAGLGLVLTSFGSGFDHTLFIEGWLLICAALLMDIRLTLKEDRS